MKKPPSRIRYEKSHPVVSARLNMNDYKRLKNMLKTEGKSFAQFLREIVNEAEIDFFKAYEQGYDHGTLEWQICYFCNICDEDLKVEPMSESHMAIIDYMKKYGWGHRSCHAKNR